MKENAEAHKIIVESSEYRAEIQKTGDEWLVSVFSGQSRLHAYETTQTLEDADGLHFILSIGNDIGCTDQYSYYALDSPLNRNLVDTFTSLITDVESLQEPDKEKSYVMIFCRYLSLGEQLGFTWEQIEHAYLNKNKINHERQEDGY